MQKKEALIIIGVLFFLFVSTFIVFLLTSSSSSSTATKKNSSVKLSQNKLIYFYGVTCPHCKEVSNFLQKEKIEEKLDFEKLEVYYNRDNAALMQQAAKKCGLNTNAIGVPFVYNRGKCYIGTPEVKKIFLKAVKKSD